MADRDSSRPFADWLHFALLLLLVSGLQAGRLLVGAESGFTFPVFARSLNSWLPAVAGIAISIGGPHSKVTRNGVLIAVSVVVLMTLLDLAGGASLGRMEAPALYPDASVMAGASERAIASWVQTAIDWLSGSLGGAARSNQAYGFDDPRFRAAMAVSEGGFTLVVFAIVGFVIAAMSWIRIHVIFRRAQDARVVYIVVAWLVAPLIGGIAHRLAADQRFRVLFQGADLWWPIVPPVLILLAGILAWAYTARYRKASNA